MSVTSSYTDYPPHLKGEYAYGSTMRRLRETFSEETAHFLAALERLQYDTTLPQGMSAWVNDHDSMDVHTLQIRVDALSGEVRQVWSPPKRNVVWGPTFAQFFENMTQYSRRDYRVMQSLRSDDTTFIGYDASMHTIVVYVIHQGETDE